VDLEVPRSSRGGGTTSEPLFVFLGQAVEFPGLGGEVALARVLAPGELTPSTRRLSGRLRASRYPSRAAPVA
jgi:hypothetical protein